MQAFDAIANTYDADFTNSEVGKLQRKIVWGYLEKQIIGGETILEINCGTGEDGVFLTQRGGLVTACDASEAMLAVAQEKFKKYQLHIETFCWDLNGYFPFPDQKYDIIFSNFGGLNCLAPEAVKKLSTEFYKLLNPGGKLIFVVMGRFCLMEAMYFLSKGKFRTAFRRRSKRPVQARLAKNVFVDTWYYPSNKIQGIFSEHFHLVEKKPVGVFIPPSYLDSIFSKRKSVLKLLARVDCMLENVSILSSCSDHYIIELEMI